MSYDDAIRSFHRLADQAFNCRLSDESIGAEKNLSLLDRQLLENLTQEARALSLMSPHRALALMTVVDKAAGLFSKDLYLESLAAWHLAWAGNKVVQPALVEEAVGRARRGFAKLKDQTWLAACTWQYYALPWTRNNRIQARDELYAAYAILEKTDSQELAAQCQLSLASTQVMTRDLKEALASATQSEKYFSLQGDRLNRARSWVVQASIFRREAKFDESVERFNQAKQVFEVFDAIVDRAEVDYQLGLLYYLSAQDFQLAIRHFNLALEVFEECNLEIWKALCWHGLGQVHTDLGNIPEAGRLLELVQEVYEKYEIYGIRANHLHDFGRLERMRGRFDISIHLFQKSEELYKKIGSHSMSILSKEIGGTYGDLGRFQVCLQYLERARNELILMENETRIAECDLSIAQVWMKLNFPDIAEEYLNDAEEICKRLQRGAMLSEIYNCQAWLSISRGDISAAVETLERALFMTKAHHLEHEAALSNRLLGEAYLSGSHFGQAIRYFKVAEEKFRKLGMGFDRAFCLFYLAEIYNELDNYKQAAIRYEEALKECGGVVHEIEWRVYGGMGRLAEKRDNPAAALESYKKSMAALNMIRDTIWQPSLVQEYLAAPTRVLSRAVELAGTMGQASDTLEFIEGGKSRAFLYQLQQTHRMKQVVESLDLANMRAEIVWLQNRLKYQMDETQKLPIAMYKSEFHKKLLESMGKYNQELEKYERQHFTSSLDSNRKEVFCLEAFQKFAIEIWGEDWTVIDYYMTENKLTGVWLTKDSSHLWQENISDRARMALEACEKMQRRGDALNENDLSTLGSLLIPSAVLDRLNVETKLLLAPHGALHRIPWSILRVGENKRFLVEECTPVNVISLQALSLMKLRAAIENGRSYQNGMLIALSQFGDRYRALPSIDDEIEVLNQYLGPDGKALVGDEATWKNLKAVGVAQQGEKETGLSGFDFLHIASHIFSDARTGRLSGIALSDCDVWLDQLNDLAPLSRLVVLSGCNGIQSLVFKGDEHISIAVRCLLAGAQRVVGSLWPVLDFPTAGLMDDFYSRLIVSGSPSNALSRLQRKAIQSGMPWNIWGGFCCVGIP
jgi:CHAT domain-containing protein